jgi:hypothetical protein
VSEPDLRPTPSAGYTPQPATTSSGTWWKSLKFRLGIIVLIAIVGLGFGLFRGVRQHLPQEFTSLLPESERPAREQAMRRAVEAFYANPSKETVQATWDAIFAWRRTFPDADLRSLVEPSAKVVCVTPRECDLMNERSIQAQRDLDTQIQLRHLSSLPSSSIEYHLKVALDLAMERRIAVATPTDMIAQDLKRLNREKELDGVRERFFNDIDKAMGAYNASKDQSAVPGLIQYLKIYADAAKGSMKEITQGRACPATVFKDGQLCESSSRAVNSAYYRDQATRIAVAKQALKDRDAPMEDLENAINQIFR